MPIRPETKHLYPPDWPEISRRIRERAGNRCEKCGRQNGRNHAVTDIGEWIEVDVENMASVGEWHDSDGTEHPGKHAGPNIHYADSDYRIVKTVLTVAHLDHNPSNCADDNLRAWCQRCHLTYDAKKHASTARATRARRAGQGELPGVK